MEFILTNLTEVFIVLFIAAWLVLRRNGVWQDKVTARHSEHRFFGGSYKEAVSAVEDALRYSQFDVTDRNYRKGMVAAKTKWTMKSFGEQIQVTLTPREDGVLIHFHSACNLETQLIDWGKNRQNAEQFFKVIDLYNR